MNRVLGTLLLTLALPMAAWANSSSIVFSNSGGRITLGAGNTLSLHNSVLRSLTGLNGVTVNGTLGTVSFTTGVLQSGTMAGGGVFAAGGSFTIRGNGTNHLPKGILFQGTFSGPVSWVASFNPHGNRGRGAWTYVLSGAVQGTINNGSPARGGTVQFTFDVPSGQFSKSVRLNHGVTTVTVPEPGGLGLLGSGLFLLSGLVRRKLSVAS